MGFMELDNFSEQSQLCLREAQKLALGRGHQRLMPEHILSSLLKNESGIAQKLIIASGLDLQNVNRELEKALAKLPTV